MIAPWKLVGSTATLSANSLSGVVDVAHPDRGLELLVQGQVIASSALGIGRSTQQHVAAPEVTRRPSDWPLPLSEVYVRDDDVVAAYHPSEDWPYAPQVYWRANPFRDIDSVQGSLALFVSLQTQLLDTRPTVSLVTRMRSSEVLQVEVANAAVAQVTPISDEPVARSVGTASCIVRRLTAMSLSYVEIVPASDFCARSAQGMATREPYIAWHLFAEFLEKGVIRKARAYAAIVPTAHDIELAIECATAIDQSPLPLTV